MRKTAPSAPATLVDCTSFHFSLAVRMKRSYSSTVTTPRRFPYKKRRTGSYLSKKAVIKDKPFETYGGIVSLPLKLWAPGITTRICRTKETVFQIQYGGPTKTVAAYYFKLSDFQSSDLSALFDQYRFVGIEFKMLPRDTQYSPGSSSPAPQYIISAVDYDDASPPTDETTLFQYQNCQTHPFDKPWVRRFRPNMAMGAYASSAFTSYANRTLQWIDVASPDVEHYGMKICSSSYSSGNTGTGPVWDVVVKAYIEFRAVR